MRLARLLCVVAAGLLTMPVSADDTALSKVPADVAFFSTSLKLGEQWDRFAKSKSYAQLSQLPAMKLVADKWAEQLAEPDNPLSQVSKAMKDPANQELVALLGDMVRDEFFLSAGAGWSEFTGLLMEVNGAMQFGPLMALAQGQGAGKEASGLQLKAALDALAENADSLAVPEFVLGFRLKDGKKAESQIRRLEEYLKQAIGNNPVFKGRINRKKIGSDDALTVTLDGEQVPWDKIPFNDIADEEGDYDDLVKKLKTMKLVMTLVMRDGYLLFGFGPDVKGVETFGKGPALAGRDELKVLAKHAGLKLLAVTYSSKALAAAAAMTPGDLESMAADAKEMLENAPISDDRKKAVGDDLEAMLKEIGKTLPEPAATVDLAFATERGQETYSYTFDKSGAKAAPLKLLKHLGGSPLIAAVGPTPSALPTYQAVVKWAKIFVRHGEGILEDLAPFFVQQYRAGMDIAKPYLERFDNLNSTLLGALGDGEAAFVMDAKWTSSAWFPEVDQKGQSLPMVEVGIVRTVKDEAALTKAFVGYRKWVNDILDKARDAGAPIPDDGWPKPETRKTGAATSYYWPLPELGQDKQMRPNITVGGGALVTSLSLGHAERLLKPTPLKTEGPLALDRPLLGASVFDVGGTVKAGRAWIELFGLPALEEAAADAPEEVRGKKAVEQFKVVLDVLERIGPITSITYRDGGATVTHTEVVIRE